jgi:hypothetical protein
MTPIEMAREIVKQYYPEMRPSYNGRRVKIALAMHTARQVEIDELVKCLAATFADPMRLLNSEIAMNETCVLLTKHGASK